MLEYEAKISVGDAFKKRNRSSKDQSKGNQQKGFLLSQLRSICEKILFIKNHNILFKIISHILLSSVKTSKLANWPPQANQ